MKSTRNLRFRLRLMEGALVLLFGVFTTAAVSTHQLLLDAANHPASAVSLSSPNWTGTLADTRLSANVPLLNAVNNTFVGQLTAIGLTTNGLVVYGSINTDSGQFIDDANNLTVATIYSDGAGITSDGSGNLSVGSLFSGTGGYLIADGAGNLYAGNTLLADNGGDIYANGAVVIDGGGSFYGSTLALANPGGNAYALTVSSGGVSLDNGLATTNGSGTLTCHGINVVANGISIANPIAASGHAILDPAKGPVLYSPSGSAWKLSVSNTGTLTVSSYP